MQFKFYFKTFASHTHANLFCGEDSRTLAKCGELTFRNEEWEIFKLIECEAAGITFEEWVEVDLR